MGANAVVKKGNGKPFVEYKDVWQSANARLKEYDQKLRDSGTPDMYFGVTYNGEGLKPSYTSIDGTVHMGSPNTAPNTIPRVPAAYSRTSARTANDIAQGGMTKQEVQEFNIKHPNETVMRGQ